MQTPAPLRLPRSEAHRILLDAALCARCPTLRASAWLSAKSASGHPALQHRLPTPIRPTRGDAA